MKKKLIIHIILILFLISGGTFSYAGPTGASSVGRPPPQQVPASGQSQVSKATKKAKYLQKMSQQSKQSMQHVRPTLTAQERQQFDIISRLVRKAAVDSQARKQLDAKWAALVRSQASRNANLDIDTMVQAVMFEAWQHEEQELRQALSDMHQVNELKKQTRNELKRARAHRQKMKTLPTEKKDYRAAGIKSVGKPTPIKTAAGMDSFIKDLEEELGTIGDDAQLANIDLQNALQKQQQMIQTLSQVSKMLHDTAMAVIRKIGYLHRAVYV